MGGKGRGIFSDFRLGRVRSRQHSGGFYNADSAAVPIPTQRACRKLAWCEEGKLVRKGTWMAFLYYLYIMTRRHLIGRRFCTECNTVQQLRQ
jgi:hypothetical protein